MTSFVIGISIEIFSTILNGNGFIEKYSFRGPKNKYIGGFPPPPTLSQRGIVIMVSFHQNICPSYYRREILCQIWRKSVVEIATCDAWIHSQALSFEQKTSKRVSGTQDRCSSHGLGGSHPGGKTVKLSLNNLAQIGRIFEIALTVSSRAKTHKHAH